MEAQGAPRGMLILVPQDRETTWVQVCWVHPAWRRRGLGTRLLTAALARATRRGHAFVRAHVAATARAEISFLRATGFRQLDPGAPDAPPEAPGWICYECFAAPRSAGPEERAFWTALEYAVSAWLHDHPLHGPRGLWCDGFNPGGFHLRASDPRVEGVMWMGPESWSFCLHLPQTAPTRDTLPWATLPSDVGGAWAATLDVAGRHLVLMPRPTSPEDG